MLDYTIMTSWSLWKNTRISHLVVGRIDSIIQMCLESEGNYPIYRYSCEKYEFFRRRYLLMVFVKFPDRST